MAHRLHWLRSLQLNSPWYLDSCKKFARAMASCLSHLVIHAPNFVELDLRSCEVLFSVDDGFAQVVGAAVRLQKLTLNNANLCALKMLRHSSLRLSSARISVVYEAVEPSFSDHPLLALHNSKDTLRTLTLDNIAFDPDRSMPRYPNLAHFEFSSLFVPPIHHLVQIFPNLQTLKVGTFPGYNHLNDTEAEAERQTNIRAQAQHGTFHALRAYTGSTLALYLIALTCHIPSLSLCDEDRHSCWDMYMLQTVCARARPTHLRLHTSFVEDWPYEAEGFVQLWASEGLRATHTLTLHLDITWHAGDVDLEPVLESVYAAVRGSSLSAVELILDWQQFLKDRFEEEIDPESPPPAWAFLWSVDVEEVADELFETTETLRTAVVRLRPPEKPEVTARRGPDIDHSNVVN